MTFVKGSYALILRLKEAQTLPIRRLGMLHFPGGIYLYFGSAHGPGGLKARLAHHARIAQKPHWHIDFLRAKAELLGGWMVEEAQTQGGMPLECQWSQEYALKPGVSIPVPGFGASDCRRGCAAHLVYLGELSDEEIENLKQIGYNEWTL